MASVLPRGVVVTLDQLAQACAWRAANERAGYKKDVAKDLQNVQLYGKELAQLLQQSGASPNTAQAIVDLCGYAGWHAANVRANNKKDAEKDMQQVEAMANSIISRGELSPFLVERIKQLALSWAWHAANTRKDYLKDAEEDRKRAGVVLTQMWAS